MIGAAKRKSTFPAGFAALRLVLLLVVAFCLPETRVWGFAATPQPASGVFESASPSSIGENTIAWQYDVSGSPVAARVTPKPTTAIQPYFPANNGFLGATEKQFLMPGQMIDRYGGSGYSRFFSPAGTPEAARALPAGSAGQPLRTFEVMKPFPVDAGTVAPAFGQPGLGQQFVTPIKLEILLKRGVVREVTP